LARITSFCVVKPWNSQYGKPDDGTWMPYCVTLPDASFLVSFCAMLDQLGPVGRRLVRVQAGFLEQLLVPVQHDGAALERHAPGLAADLAVQHEGLVEAAEPGLVVGGLDEVVDRHHRVFVDQREHVGGQQHAGHRRRAGLVRGERLDDGVLVAAGVDRLHLDRRVSPC
jgi:hypothetical protein